MLTRNSRYSCFLQKNIEYIRSYLDRAILIFIILEVLFFPSIETLYAVTIILIGYSITFRFIFQTENLLFYPVSSLMIIFYALFFFVLPIPATLIEAKSVVYNLHNSYETYFQLLFLLVLLVIIHAVYKSITLHRTNTLTTLYKKFNFFSRLSTAQIWILIILSSLYFCVSVMMYGRFGDDGKNADVPLVVYILGLFFAQYSVLVIVLLFPQFNIIKKWKKTNYVFIFLVFIVNFLVGISANLRTASLLIISSAVFASIVYAFYYSVDLKKVFTLKNVFLFVVVTYFFFGVFLDISKAMVQVRELRYGTSGVEMIQKTLETYQAKNKFTDVNQKRNINNYIGWDEHYLNNDILNRFCSIKILDETLFHAERVGYNNPAMRSYLYDQIIQSLPSFIKGKLDVNQDLEAGTLTDYLYSLSVNSPTVIHGARIGTLQGLGLALFGYWYPIILFPIFFIIFYILDATVFYDEKRDRMIFSVWFFANIVLCCYYFSDRHYYFFEARFLLRGYLESIVFYLVTINIIRRFFSKS